MTYAKQVRETMTKKELIEEYNRLLDQFNRELAAKDEAQSRVREADRTKDREALETGLAATVDSVLEGASRLRALVGTTLNDLADQMTRQAEKLERLNRAVALQEGKLNELHQIEHAADTMAKLAAAYGHERSRLESGFADRTRELEAAFARTSEELERAHAERRAQLEGELAEQRARWEREKEETVREREREEAEYQYERERSRRLAETEHAERKAALEKELRQLREKHEAGWAEREAALRAREQEVARMTAEVAAFPARLERAVEEAREDARARAVEELEHQAALAQVERDWEKRSLEQTIAHLQAANQALEKKLSDQAAELREARKQVNAIAEKAVEGASVARLLSAGGQTAEGRGADKPRRE
jgi:hypothetical protein